MLIKKYLFRKCIKIFFYYLTHKNEQYIMVAFQLPSRKVYKQKLQQKRVFVGFFMTL